ncbi:MAG: hypothetical protein LBB74_00400, partial [Chitinispirillales bacterium]|nr:hypothetical protein [Chitinispirillales bacterium]
MENSTIVKSVEWFSAALGIILAVGGVVLVFGKKLRGNVLAAWSCVAVAAAFVLEVTAFNFPFYSTMRYFAGPQIGITGVSETDSNVILTTDSSVKAGSIEGGRRFAGLNGAVASVFAGIEFKELETLRMLVRWTDEKGTRQCEKRIYKYMPRENYAALRTRGKISEFSIIFAPDANITTSFDVANLVLNKPIPFYFNGLRVFVMSLLFLML